MHGRQGVLCAAMWVLAMTGGCQSTGLMLSAQTPKLKALDGIITAGIEARSYPGAVIIVGKKGQALYAKAYGRQTFDPDSPRMALNTIFDLASVSKLVGTTSAALLNLDDGKLGLDDPVAKYIPGFEAEGKEAVTIRDLMTHVSGLKPYESKDAVEKSRREDESTADALIRAYAALKLAYPPRTDYRYSCLNFQTMARVNEVAANERMEDLLVQRVYGPLGMKDTRYVLTKEQLARTAPTHRGPDGDLCRGEVHDPLARYHGSAEHCPGNAGLYSTARDLAIYCRMILNEGSWRGRRIFQADTLRMATRRQTPEGVTASHGLGFAIYRSAPYATELNQKPETQIVGHFGYTGTWVWIDKYSGTFMVLLTNRTFPAEEGKVDQTPSIESVRKGAVDLVLRSLPEYAEYFAAQPATATAPAEQ